MGTQFRHRRCLPWSLLGWVGLGLGALQSGGRTAVPPLPTVDGPPPQVHAYDLGLFTLTQQGVADEYSEMPVPLRGILARPEGAGPFPVVILLHGRHSGCHFAPLWSDSRWPCPPEAETRFDQGFAYLAAALAEQGYLTLAIDLNGAYAYAYGATPDNYTALAHQRSPQILGAHLAQLAAAHRGEPTDFGLPLAGQVDLSRLVLMGHSMGGAAAVFSGLEPAGLLLVAPTPSQNPATAPAAYELPDVPTSILLGGCDRDIYDFSSLYYFETAAQQPRRHWVASVLIPGVNHNFFNRALIEDDYARQPDNGPQCSPDSSYRLGRIAQEDFLVAYATGFLRQVFDPKAAVGLALTPNQAAPNQLLGVPVLTNLHPGQTLQRRLRLDPADASGGASPPTPTAGLGVQICRALQGCDRFWRPRPHFPTVLRLSWRQQPQALRLALPPSSQDLSAFTSLQLRLAVDATDALTDGQPVALAVILQDQQGRAVRVEVPATTPALRAAAADPRWGYQGIPIYPSAVRISLAQFEGVDLTAIAALTLVFDRSDRGVLYLADIVFL
jgi:dienelactone hydrolase